MHICSSPSLCFLSSHFQCKVSSALHSLSISFSVNTRCFASLSLHSSFSPSLPFYLSVSIAPYQLVSIIYSTFIISIPYPFQFSPACRIMACTDVQPYRKHDLLGYYKLLELTPNATASEIRRAYYTLALRYHPDKNTSDEAEVMVCWEW